MKGFCQIVGLCIVWLVALSCTSTAGSSFQTLGVPDVSPPPSRAAVILGWEGEEREGWSIARVKVDGRARSEWDQDSQHPVVIYLEPGQRSVQLLAEQRRLERGGSVVKRYRSKAVAFQIEERTSELCVIRIAGKNRRRPRISCSDYGRSAATRALQNDESSFGKRAVAERPASSELVGSPYPSAEHDDRADEPNVKKLLSTPYSAERETAPDPSPSQVRADLLKNPYDNQDGITERIRLLEERLERIEQALSKSRGEGATP